MKAAFRGIFLTSEDPASTAKFYLDVAGLDLEQIGSGGEYVYWRIDTDGVQLAIHDAKRFGMDAYPAVAGSNLIHLYFKVTSQEDFLQRLGELNIKPQSMDEVVVTVIDPDGRKVMFGTA